MHDVEEALDEIRLKLTASRLNIDTEWLGQDLDPLRIRIQQAIGKDFGSMTIVIRMPGNSLLLYVKFAGLGKMDPQSFADKAQPEMEGIFSRIHSRKIGSNFVEWVIKFNL